MTKILIVGALGRMGKKVYEASLSNEEALVCCGVDVVSSNDLPYPVYDSFNSVKENPDVLIDFSAKANLDNVLAFIKKTGCSAVLCATGYDQEDIEKINQATKTNAIFRSANMSLGVNVLIELVKEAAKKLAGFDIEIIEKHHNQKKDAPSGTALMLADGVKDVLPQKFYIYGREGMVGKRTPDEIGIHAIRGGNIVGDHDVIFAGQNETVTLSHVASDRSVFAEGAIKASLYIAKKQSGLFNMSDMLNNK